MNSVKPNSRKVIHYQLTVMEGFECYEPWEELRLGLILSAGVHMGTRVGLAHTPTSGILPPCTYLLPRSNIHDSATFRRG